ncbi:uncharacterized protein FOMMEDRAFT_140535 [Fomitiporia mediterranea MF3/22]|uniref:uncharacterized protein n=1 Tax=Fomitiporia mediterranea (strain MF3/22) TaxID=694068 RepID=UPI0004409CE6|nr:uncharacterized protein FOMMEDRAFT_140535 [Fomitiporia mediterranea MF3/22]EJD02589.1 hypothetical protein FOMMEDRAFT_140535 [Fomitiporia mediterranea MF3/22]
MAKFKRSSVENNRKLTDYFSQLPPSSSQTSQASPPPSCPASSSAPYYSAKASMGTKKTILKETKALSRSPSSSQSGLMSQSSLQSRIERKENAPPPRLMRTRTCSEREIISIASSSEAPTHITISSNSVTSFDSSVIEVVPPVKQDRGHLQAIDVTSSPLSAPVQTRRSPRLKGPKSPPRSRIQQVGAVVAQKRSPKKRKKPEGVQSDDGDLIELDAMEDVIYVDSSPSKLKSTANVKLVPPSRAGPPATSSSRKRSRLNEPIPIDSSSDVEEVIPSSQSDERELCIPKRQRKNIKEVMEGIREWQLSSSQPAAPPESSDAFAANVKDWSMELDLEYPYSSASLSGARSGRVTPVAADKSMHTSPRTTPQTCYKPRTPSKIPEMLCAFKLPESVLVAGGSKPSSPVFVSSASSLTKVDTPTQMSLIKRLVSPVRTPDRRHSLDETGSPGLRNPHVASDRTEVEIEQVDVSLDCGEKTNAIVERIKAEARAKAMTMPDEDSMVLGSLDDSDSDLESPSDLFKQVAKGKEPSKSSRKRHSPSLDEGASDDGTESSDIAESGNRSTRRRSARLARDSHSPSPPRTTRRTRNVPSMRPTVIFETTRESSKKTVNPFSKLLKDKARQDRFADIHQNPGIGADIDFLDAADEEFAGCRSLSGSPLRRQSSDEAVMNEADRARLFGEGDDVALGKILETDRLERGKDKVVVDITGVPFWENPSEDGMDIDPETEGLPQLVTSGTDAMLVLLKDLIDSRDVDGIAMLLQSGSLVTEDEAFVTWAFELAICAAGTLAIAAHTLLCRICDASSEGLQSTVVSVTPALKMLSRLGAKQSIVEAIQLETSFLPSPSLTADHRRDTLWRFSDLVERFASKAMFVSEDVPSYFALLLAVGLDPSTGLRLKLCIKRALCALIRQFCEVSDERGEMEREICSRTLCLCSQLSSANKAYLLSFIEGDRLVDRRIGQWVAFAMLTGEHGSRLAREFVLGPPPLSDIVALLDPRSDSELHTDLFAISRNAEETDCFDYAALGYHVEVLGRVLMNIPQYVLLEKVEAREALRQSSSSDLSASKSFPRHRNEKSKLEIIKCLLDRLGNNIADTRAAHLDRSHTKAVIQQLAMRIHYQREGSRERKSNIDKYFSVKST